MKTGSQTNRLPGFLALRPLLLAVRQTGSGARPGQGSQPAGSSRRTERAN